MQRAKASACWAFVDWESADARAADEPRAPVDDGLALLNAAAGRARLAVAMIAAAVRAVGVHARRGWRMTRMLWFIMPSSHWLIVSPASQPLLCCT